MEWYERVTINNNNTHTMTHRTDCSSYTDLIHGLNMCVLVEYSYETNACLFEIQCDLMGSSTTKYVALCEIRKSLSLLLLLLVLLVAAAAAAATSVAALCRSISMSSFQPFQNIAYSSASVFGVNSFLLRLRYTTPCIQHKMRCVFDSFEQNPKINNIKWLCATSLIRMVLRDFLLCR